MDRVTWDESSLRPSSGAPIRGACARSTKFGGVLFSVALLFSMSPASAAEQDRVRMPVVVSFSILADWTSGIGRDRIEVTTLAGRDSDAHIYRPSPVAARALAGARLVIINGLGLEGWLSRLIQASGSKARVVESAEGVKLYARDGYPGSRPSADPHAWHDVRNARIYIDNIKTGLCLADPGECDFYSKNAAGYDAELSRLHEWIKASLAHIPRRHRVVVTPHDSFNYYEHAYGVSFRAPTGYSTESEASAADVARLIREIRTSGARALFVENIADRRLIDQIGRETGLRPGGTLYSDALSSVAGPAPTYIKMMRHNTSTIASALERNHGEQRH